MWKVMCMLEKSRMENCDGEHGGSSDDGFVLFNKVISIDLPKWLQMIQVLMEVREQVLLSPFICLLMYPFALHLFSLIFFIKMIFACT